MNHTLSLTGSKSMWCTVNDVFSNMSFSTLLDVQFTEISNA